MDTTFRTFFFSLSDTEKESYAAAAGTTVGYIRAHLISSPPRKVPRPVLIDGLISASNGSLNRADLLSHIYPPVDKDVA